ncbi:phosphoadenylyl-sulfate reductase [Tessaracoccus lacteus]|uniref:Adenosine 5'-phosphosulfate reductase n=1 Tax=Tessaracoccus lacteus TaxID=3041766 RepID=A0ABY8PZ82_9ACTN|nr:phosphoadenylyl-sulfate reductase [Tessaracoccus sp. T21]WGT47764.1 phosphoadenylyl-sulfate reductase [Tessaracoccus sp. T21]
MTTTMTTDELRALADEAAARFAELEADPRHTGHLGRVELSRQVLAWAAETFVDDVTVASSMGDEVLVELVAQAAPTMDVFFLDTGFHFPETLRTRDHYADRVRIRTVLPLLTVDEQAAEHGDRLFDRDPDRCCAIRKVEPLNRALSGRAAWVTGMRRVDAPTRTDIGLVGWDERRQMVKVNPIAAWDDDDVDRFAFEEDVFLNPLREKGYPSIGCAPCTRPVAPGEDARAGRWAGKNKTECGLHT